MHGWGDTNQNVALSSCRTGVTIGPGDMGLGYTEVLISFTLWKLYKKFLMKEMEVYMDLRT